MLIKLEKDGGWIDPHSVMVVAVFERAESHVPRVGICVAGFMIHICCESHEEALAVRDRIATEINLYQVEQWTAPRNPTAPRGTAD